MRGTPRREANFAGGVNTKAGSYGVAENEARDLRNVVGTARGAVRKRNGDVTFCSTFTGSPQWVITLFPAQLTSSPWLLAVDYNGKIHKISSGGTATDISGGVTMNTNSSFIEAPVSGGQGPIWILTGGTARQWTGAGNIATWTASSGSIPAARFMTYFKNRVWAAGDLGAQSRLYFSGNSTGGGLADPRNWGGGLFVDINPDDGDIITGLGTIGPYLLVFKNRSVHVVYDLDTGANRVLSSKIGCSARGSIVESPQGTFFFSYDRGIYQTDGDSLNQLSERITPILDGVDKSLAIYNGIFFADHYYLTVNSTTGLPLAAPDLVLDYDTQLDSWWLHSDPQWSYAVWRPDGITPTLFGARALGTASSVVAKLYQPNTYQDYGANYTAYWTGPWLTFGEPFRHKRVRQIHYDGSGQADVLFMRDFTEDATAADADIFTYAVGGSFGGSGTFGGSSGYFGDHVTQAERRIFNYGVVRAMSVKVSGTHSNPFELDAYSPLLTPRAN